MKSSTKVDFVVLRVLVLNTLITTLEDAMLVSLHVYLVRLQLPVRVVLLVICCVQISALLGKIARKDTSSITTVVCLVVRINYGVILRAVCVWNSAQISH